MSLVQGAVAITRRCICLAFAECVRRVEVGAGVEVYVNIKVGSLMGESRLTYFISCILSKL